MAQRFLVAGLGRPRLSFNVRVIVGGVLSAPAVVVGLLPRWQKRANERHYLATLSDHVTRDIGLDHADVGRRSPPTRRRD